ncbi:glycosyltransferase [Formosa sp. PL04]|uniref:glycosyltransferase n=1 Tax=Formosa sp. PL04 TaxID=3081755 RepID=UPI0029820D75|nr:glycosyltransferase [Formosa sp. PL04]MDW5289126.1 glycosyltransferase [Formosa sp. PL04]
MKTATLTSTQFNILESPFSGSELLNRLIFQNKSIPGKDTILWSKITLVSIFMLMLAAAYGIYVFYQAFNDILLNPLYNPLFYGFFIVANGWFAFSGLAYLYKLHLYLKYKSIESISDDSLPKTTVIISAYNEGKQVYDTLISLAKSDYPEEKLQLIAINDGSTDDTWSWMHEAKNDLGDRVTISQQPKTMGKSQALHRGISIGTGEIFVNVDSNAIIDKDTLRNLVSRFIVSGRNRTESKGVRILNKEKQIVSKTDQDTGLTNILLRFSALRLFQGHANAYSKVSAESKKFYNMFIKPSTIKVLFVKTFTRLDMYLLNVEKVLKQNLSFSA